MPAEVGIRPIPSPAPSRRRERWFISSAHDQKCLDETLQKFEEAVDLTLDELSRGRHDENKLMPGISG